MQLHPGAGAGAGGGVVGRETSDDAAVYQINDEQAIVATTDFFMPIVDDPYDFGRIAATNALSDIYAMNASAFSQKAIPPSRPLAWSPMVWSVPSSKAPWKWGRGH